ncbi:uncharacterized protein MYCFIDRAFT_213086 [Pseudocercospora fijiensis CIRAD86]|uniref:Uncharacterized protein n=1 Tax=Pseudocercospora fijiensis (strain CIRAD86) TaxID=383855 RepID=N1QAI2_PSEFD|nr:uncharacterized protein MYCFIDRAFT_213086 [Pseudocercospora fijiensis CIRAD86]EME87957.1 hypothetical protein MYCFIDRAFT_213086 [Pseudocercospora fijiensis CIRAD86]
MALALSRPNGMVRQVGTSAWTRTRNGRASRRSYTATASLLSTEDRMPRIATTSFWTSLVPRFLRRSTSEEEATERARRRDVGAEERRAGIILLVLGIVVGSNAINIISLRREMLNFSRQTDAKLDLLRGVVSRVRNGEEFDVKKALGTGDPEQEKEWAQVMEELENTDMLLESRTKKEAKRAEKAEERRRREEIRARTESSEAPESSKKPTPKFLM